MRLFRGSFPGPLPVGARFADGRDVRLVIMDGIGPDVRDIHVLNDHGLLSLRVDANGRRYKVFECESQARAALAATALNRVAEAAGPVPRCLHRSGAVLFTHWVEGRPCNEEPLPMQARWLALCQLALLDTVVPEDAGAPRFLHLESLAGRLRLQGRRVLPETHIDAVLARLWAQLPPLQSPHIIHPDLTPANVVITEHGPVIIDNEAIVMAHGREFDIWNTAEALYGRRDSAGIESYVRGLSVQRPLPSLYDYRTVWDAFRIMRQGLKALEKGRLIKARWLLRQL